MSRLSEHLRAVSASGRKAMGLFLTSSFPEPAATLPLLRAIDEAGADFIELGMPFSDPLAEGLPIQRSSERALAAGASIEGALAQAAEFRAGSSTPLVLMGYVNPLLRYGVSNFFKAARSSGVDGVILPDLPPAERGLVANAAAENHIDLIHLIAPNTPSERVQEIDSLSSGFVYAVSITGLTGTGLGAVEAVSSYLATARRLVTENPLLVGFGIASSDDARRLTEHTDGFIVGSALIRTVESAWDNESLTPSQRLGAVSAFVRSLRSGPIPTAS